MSQLGIATLCILITDYVFGGLQFNQCGEPPPSSNTYRFFPDNVTVKYRCVDNFNLISGNLTRTCADGNYTGETPVCLYSCGPPLNTSYASISYVDTLIDSTVSYTCPNNSVLPSSVSKCDYNAELWKYGDQCYSDQPLNRSYFSVSANTARRADILNSTGEPRTESTPGSDDPDDILLFGAANAIDDDTGTSLLKGSCSSTAAGSSPSYKITLDDYYDIYKLVLTLPDDAFAYQPTKLTIQSTYDGYGSSDTCITHRSLVKRGTVFVAECHQSRYRNYGNRITISTSYGHNKSGMLQICDLQVYARLLRNVDCGQPNKIPYAFITHPPVSTRQGDNTRVGYQCMEGFHAKKGSEWAHCAPNGYWNTTLICTADGENLALLKPVQMSQNNQSIPFLTDGNTSSCYVITDVREVEFTVDVMDTSEVSDVSVTLTANSSILPSMEVEVNREGTRSVTCTRVRMRVTDGYTLNIGCRLYPVGRYVTLKVSFTENSTLQICDIAVHGRPYTEALECTRENNPMEYKGTLNMTVMGIPCQRWDSQSPHTHSHTDISRFPDATLSDAGNFCRNPAGRRSPWCYTTDSSIPWQYCPVPKCDSVCLSDEKGRTYHGGFQFTTSGSQCVRWKQTTMPAIPKSQFSQLGSSTAACRNPSLSQSKPWCYTSSDASQYGHCPIPSCPKSPEMTWGYWVMHETQTLEDLLPAAECHAWRKFWKNGVMSGTINTAGDSTRYESSQVTVSSICKAGAVHNSTIICWDDTPDGVVWKAGVLECVDCGQPPNVINATVSYSAALRFSTAIYTCVPGYAQASGSDNVTCLQSGDWETPDMVCEPSCGDPPEVANTIVSATPGFVNDTANYTCVDRFAIVSGSVEITCQDNVTWEQPSIHCEVNCGVPPQIINTTLDYNTTFVNSTAKYRCTEGYGTVLLTCNTNGLWENPGFACKDSSSSQTKYLWSTNAPSLNLDVTSFSLDMTSLDTPKMTSIVTNTLFSYPDVTSFSSDVTSLDTPEMTSLVSMSSLNAVTPSLLNTDSMTLMTASVDSFQPTISTLNSIPVSVSYSSPVSFITMNYVSGTTAADQMTSSATRSELTVVDKYGRTRSEVCVCRCVKKKTELDILIKTLTVTRTQLTSYRNSKVSVPDSRPLSAGIGVFSITMMVLMFGVFFVNDLLNIIIHINAYLQQKVRHL